MALHELRTEGSSPRSDQEVCAIWELILEPKEGSGQLGGDSLDQGWFPPPSASLYWPARVTTASPACPGDPGSRGFNSKPAADLCPLACPSSLT